jgi:ribosomal protein S12 methylthiotransferase accessory factor
MNMRISFPGGSRVDAEIRGFVVRTDQPAHAGGGGTAPAPFDYFIASLGTCAGLYVKSFLERRDLPTENVSLTVETVKDPERGMLSDVTIRVSLPESFPLKYRSAILSAVNACPVKRHLLQPPRMKTVVEIGGRIAAESESVVPAPDVQPAVPADHSV